MAVLRNKQALQTPVVKINNPKHNRAFNTANDAAMANSSGDKWGRMNQARENGQNRANNYMQK